MLTNRCGRRAVTLMELLVVIAIILVIVGLLLPIFLSSWQLAEETKASAEISKLDQACETFKSAFGRYPPGRLLLCETMEGYRQAIAGHLCQTHFQFTKQNQDALEWLAKDSMEYLRSIFPGIDLNAGHDWNGDGVIDDRQYFLQGDECLTFFLGGMRYGKGAVDFRGTNRTGPTGFNTDKTNPTKQTPGARLGPFFEFDAARVSYDTRTWRVVPPGPYAFDPDESTGMINWDVGTSTGLHPRPDEQSILFFPNYRDPWGTPYYYFAARTGNVDNYVHLYSPFCYKLGLLTSYYYNYHCYLADVSLDYPGTDVNSSPITINEPTSGDRYDPATKTHNSRWVGFVPYILHYKEGVGTTYHQRNRFQIISAGPDKQFGGGGYYDPSNPEKSAFRNYKFIPEDNIPRVDEVQANYDNITNINFRRLVPKP